MGARGPSNQPTSRLVRRLRAPFGPCTRPRGVVFGPSGYRTFPGRAMNAATQPEARRAHPTPALAFLDFAVSSTFDPSFPMCTRSPRERAFSVSHPQSLTWQQVDDFVRVGQESGRRKQCATRPSRAGAVFQSTALMLMYQSARARPILRGQSSDWRRRCGARP
jgi:hypothetical protein